MSTSLTVRCPNGISTIVDISGNFGVYASAADARGAAVEDLLTFPQTITADTTYYFTKGVAGTLSAKQLGREVAGHPDGTPRAFIIQRGVDEIVSPGFDGVDSLAAAVTTDRGPLVWQWFKNTTVDEDPLLAVARHIPLDAALSDASYGEPVPEGFVNPFGNTPPAELGVAADPYHGLIFTQPGEFRVTGYYDVIMKNVIPSPDVMTLRQSWLGDLYNLVNRQIAFTPGAPLGDRIWWDSGRFRLTQELLDYLEGEATLGLQVFIQSMLGTSQLDDLGTTQETWTLTLLQYDPPPDGNTLYASDWY